MTGAWRFLPPLAIATFAILVGAVVAVSGDTFGYDFAAYWLAGRHLLDGAPLYDPAVTEAVGFGVWLYPPPAAVAFVPLALLPLGVSSAAWIAAMAAATVATVAILPVSLRTRWLVLLLAGVMWPVSYAIKLGQVTPLLVLGFAIAWRWLDRPAAIGLAGGLGGVLKLQPGLVLGWAFITRRWRAVAIGAGVAVAAAVLTLPITGLAAYGDYLALLGRVSGALATENNLAPGAIAYGLGLDEGAAGLLQLATMVAALAIAAIVAWRGSAAAGLLAAVLASQLASPVLWTHYAIVLLLPIAWLLERRGWWSIAIPLALSVPLVGGVPEATYAIAFGLVMAAIAWHGLREGRAPVGGVTGPASG